MRGAQITVRCDCGDIGYVAYGERWVCRKCRRAWNTTQIPAEEYWGIMRDMRRLRLTVMGVALCLVVPIAALTPILGVRILLLLPIVLAFWFPGGAAGYVSRPGACASGSCGLSELTCLSCSGDAPGPPNRLAGLRGARSCLPRSTCRSITPPSCSR